jgi:hypothetical protein
MKLLLLSIAILVTLPSCAIDYMRDRAYADGSKDSIDFHGQVGGEGLVETRKGDRIVRSQTKSLADVVTGATTVIGGAQLRDVELGKQATEQVATKETTKRVISGHKTTEALGAQNAGAHAINPIIPAQPPAPVVQPSN